MEIRELAKIAGSAQRTLDRMVDNKQITDYHATILPDGSEMDVYYMLNRPLKKISVTVTLPRGSLH